MDELELRNQMCEVGRRLWERGLVGAAEGNVSARLGDDRILCTPSGLSKGHMRPEQLIVIDRHGQRVDNVNPSTTGFDLDLTPSSEIKLHLRILDKRSDCVAVVHAHPPIATAFSVAGVPIPADLLPESIYVLGNVATVPFCMPGTEEVPDTIEPLLSNHKTFLLSHHGAVVMGKDLWDAYHRMETLERIAKVVLVAGLLGGAKPLPEGARSRLKLALSGIL